MKAGRECQALACGSVRFVAVRKVTLMHGDSRSRRQCGGSEVRIIIRLALRQVCAAKKPCCDPAFATRTNAFPDITARVALARPDTCFFSIAGAGTAI
jgi:hypothetical protein